MQKESSDYEANTTTNQSPVEVSLNEEVISRNISQSLTSTHKNVEKNNMLYENHETSDLSSISNLFIDSFRNEIAAEETSRNLIPKSSIQFENPELTVKYNSSIQSPTYFAEKCDAGTSSKTYDDFEDTISRNTELQTSSNPDMENITHFPEIFDLSYNPEQEKINFFEYIVSDDDLLEEPEDSNFGSHSSLNRRFWEYLEATLSTELVATLRKTEFNLENLKSSTFSEISAYFKNKGLKNGTATVIAAAVVSFFELNNNQ